MFNNIRRIPDAIGIGCRRCASSWLHQVLNEHPQIGKPPNGLHYFSEHFERGHTWYTEQFREYLSSDVLLEYSVSYLYPEYFAQVAQRIYHFNPRTKLFVSVRKPVSRAFSDYLRSIRRLELHKDIPFEQAIEQFPEFLQRGLYGKLLQPFYDLFGKEQILVLFYDDLLDDASSYVKELLCFLGVSSDMLLHSIQKREPEGKSIASESFTKFVFGTKTVAEQYALKVGLEKPWRFFKARYVSLYGKILSLNRKRATLRPETRKKLQAYYYNDIQKLELLTDRSLESWYAE